MKMKMKTPSIAGRLRKEARPCEHNSGDVSEEGWEARENAWTHFPEPPMDRSYGRCFPPLLRSRRRLRQQEAREDDREGRG